MGSQNVEQAPRWGEGLALEARTDKPCFSKGRCQGWHWERMAQVLDFSR